MRPTLFGVRLLAFHALCLGAYFATPYVNLFFMLLGFLSLVLVAAVIASRSSLAGVTVEAPSGGEALAAAGSTPSVTLAIGSETTRWRFGLVARLELEGPGGDRLTLTGSLPTLAPGARVPLELTATDTVCRGVWRAQRLELSSAYPFGVLRARRREPVALELIAHPAPSPEAAAAQGGLFSSLLAAQLGGGSALASSGVQPTSLREHRPGESLRSVHWRASARRGKLVALEWEADETEALEVVLDRRAADPEFERALSDLCAVALAARDAKDLLSVITQGASGAYGEGHEPSAALLRLLAGLQPLPSGAAPPPAASPGALRLPRPTATEARRAA